MSNVDPEEVQALVGDADTNATRTADVRDFARPRRMSGGQRGALSGIVRSLSGRLADHFRDALGKPAEVELLQISELNAGELFGDADPYPCVIGFQIEGSPGWLVWESLPAVGAVESMLGIPNERPAARTLSELEAEVLIALLQPVVGSIAEALNAEAQDFQLMQKHAGLQSSAAAGASSGDPHRLEIGLSLSIGDATSQLTFFLPGLRAQAPDEAVAGEPELAKSSLAVPVGVQARLHGSSVPLAQLLELEVGDVIPLNHRRGEPVELSVGNVRYGTARLGTHRGRLAVSLETIEKDLDG